MGKASADYINIQGLLKNGYNIQKINIQLGQRDGIATIGLLNDSGESKEIISQEDDMIILAFRWKSIYDKNGDIKHGFLRDTDEFYKNVGFLIDHDGSKTRSAGERIKKGEVKISFVPHDLIEEFLTDTGSSYKKYIPLRDNYYEIVWLHTALIKDLYNSEQTFRKKDKKTLDRLLLIYKLMSKGFRSDPNFLKNYQKLQSYSIANVYDLLDRLGSQLSEAKHQMDMLVKAGGMSPKVGLKYPIEDYASKGEILIKFMNILRVAVEVVEGNPEPALRKKSTQNWEIIKNNPKYKDVIGSFDPRIRHGKSHQSYEIDEATKTIKFYQDGRIRKLIVKYSFDEFNRMWHDLLFILQTVTIAVCMEHGVITSLMLRSGEYKSLLAGLGNFK